jgi:hypothetical protein
MAVHLAHSSGSVSASASDAMSGSSRKFWFSMSAMMPIDQIDLVGSFLTVSCSIV